MLSAGGAPSSASSYSFVSIDGSSKPHETSVADVPSSSDGSSVLDDSFGDSGATSSSGDSSGFFDANDSTVSSSELSYNDSTANSYEQEAHRRKLRTLRRAGGDTDSEASSISVGDHTLVVNSVPDTEKLIGLLKKVYRRFAPEKENHAEKIALHFAGRELDLIEGLGLKYGFNVHIAETDDTHQSDSYHSEAQPSKASSSRVSDYYEEIASIGESIAKAKNNFFRDVIRSGRKVQRTIVYPTLSLTIAMECTRDMQCFVLAKKKVRGVWYAVGRTDTLHCKPGLNPPFNRILEVMYHVGIDNGQMLLLEIMDGDHLMVGSGYFFGCVQMSVSDLQQKPYSKLEVNRTDKDDVIGIDLCTLHVQVELNTVGQCLSPRCKDPLKIAFYRQTPPTLDDFRRAFPTLSDTFGTYILSINTKDIATKHSIDPAVLSATNTRIYLKFLLNDPTGHYSDIETDPDGLECIWQSSKAMDTGRPGKHRFKVFCPVTKIEHTLLAGTRNIDDHGGDNRKVLIHLYAEGLNSKDSQTGPRLLSYTEITVKDLIAQALNTAVGTEEAEVEDRVLSKTTRKIKLAFRQVENFTSKKYREKQEAREEYRQELRNSSRIRAVSVVMKRHVSTALSGDLFHGKDDDYDSMEDELNEVVKRPADDRERHVEKEKIRESLFSEKIVGMSGTRRHLPRKGTDGEALKFGHVIISIGRVETEVKTSSGDDVYEDKLRKKFKPVLRKWLRDNGPNFHVACDAQNALTMRSTLDTEFLLNEGTDKGLQCAMIVDMNSACTQHVQYKVNQAASVLGTDATEESFKQSYVKDAMTLLFGQLTWFSKNRPFQVFAGGGVNPPGREHPSRNYSRSRAFPLCQEVLLSREEALSASQKIRLPLCGYTVWDPRSEVRKNVQRRVDPRGDLHAAMDLDDPLGIAKRYATWKGYHYNTTQRYNGYDDILSGFYEACTLYEPSMLTKQSLAERLTYQGHFRLESRAPSISNSKSSEQIRERQKRVMEIEQARQEWKIRYQAANVGTTQDLESSDLLFFADIPGTMQYDFVDALDVSALETLIHQDVAKRPVLQKEEFTAEGEVKEEQTWFGGQVKQAHDRKAVVWILGTCPSEQVLHRLGTMVEEHILHPHLPLLVIVMAAETRFDLPQTNAAAVSVTADPWTPLIACFTAAKERARKKQLARRSRRKAKMGDKYVPSTMDDMLAMYFEKEAKEEGASGHKLVSSPSHNIALAHFLTWAEVVAGAFLKEEEAMRITQILGGNSSSEDSAISEAVGDEIDVKLPKTNTLREQMSPHLPAWSVDAIIGRVRLEANADEVHAKEEAEAMKLAEGSRDSSFGPEGNDIETRSEVSGLTQPTFDCADEGGGEVAGHNSRKTKKPDADFASNKVRAGSFAAIRDRARTGLKSFVNLVIGESGKEKKNVAAPSLYASDRVSGFDELTEMKSRFDDECRSAFEKEMHTLLGSYVMLQSRLDLGKGGGEFADDGLKPYNHEMRELMEAASNNEKQEEGCSIT